MDMDQDERVVWPRDSLFRYFELLEKLQYNLEERKQLQEFAGMNLGQSLGPGVKHIGITHITGDKEESVHYFGISASEFPLHT